MRPVAVAHQRVWMVLLSLGALSLSAAFSAAESDSAAVTAPAGAPSAVGAPAVGTTAGGSSVGRSTAGGKAGGGAVTGLIWTQQVIPNRYGFNSSWNPSRPEDELHEVEGFKVGEATFHPIGSTSLTYSDNVLGERAGKQRQDWYVDYRPGLEASYKPLENFEVTGGYRFGWTDFLDNQARDYLSHDATLNLAWHEQKVEGLTYILNETYSQTGNSGIFEDQFFAFTRLGVNAVGPTVRYESEVHNSTTTYEYRKTDYFSRTMSLSDYDSHTVRQNYTYIIQDELKPTISYQFSRNLYINRLDNKSDFDTHSLLPGVYVIKDEVWEMEGRLGYGWAVNRFDDDSAGGLEALWRATYKPLETLQAHFYAHRGFAMGVRTGAGTIYDFEVGTSWQPAKNVTLDTRALFVVEDRVANQLQRTNTFSAVAGYVIKDVLKATLSFDRTDRTGLHMQPIVENKGSLGFYVRF